jgi:2-oxo-3-hexenedioate decarboxylase/2-keto-4-pentenoate hydratase
VSPNPHPRARTERAAALLARHRLSGRPFAGFADGDAPRDAAGAYEIQAALHAELAPAFGEQAGWKIGCTTETMQEYLRIREPAAGHVRSRTVHGSGIGLRHEEFRRPGVECELAVRLGRDLEGGEHEREALRTAISSVLAAIEVVDDRYADWSSLGAPSLTADDFFGAGAVLGREDVAWRDLDLGAVAATMAINGEEVGAGTGADILGDPLAALGWLVAGPARSHGLAAGSIVLLGSLVQTHWVERGDVVTVENEPFGYVSVSFS